ncbi:MAG: hypothetical protein EHM58_12670 [Ignavibacteriae bacterium]|nr:MAG: hypothetical protein EHM58_12670 [Ignavibacteriota bacterium]
MKTVSDELFRLIKSLTKSEKGYFKKFAARNTSGAKKNYIVLFDAIDKLADYDEDILKEKLDDILYKQLPVYKVYLFNLILKSLHNYGSFENAESKLNELISNIRILKSKALYKEAIKYLKKAKEIANKYYKSKYVLDLLIIERNILIQFPDKNVLENRKRIYEEQKELTKKLDKYFEYSWLSDRVVIYVEQKGDFSGEERKKEIEKIICHPFIADERNADDYLTKTYYYHTHLFYNLAQEKLENVFNILKKEIEMMDSNKHMIEENPKNYIQALINYLLFSNYTKKRHVTRETLVKLNKVRKRWENKLPPSTIIQAKFHIANTEMLIYRKSLEIAKGKAAAKRIAQELNTYQKEVPAQAKAVLLSNLCSFYFTIGDIENALKYNNMLLNDSSLSFKSDVINLAKLFQLVLHLELGNYDLLEYLSQSVYRAIKESGMMSEAQEVLFHFFKKALGYNEKELHEAYDELHYKLKKLKDEPASKSLFVMFDFISWAESKAKNEKLYTVMMRKKR